MTLKLTIFSQEKEDFVLEVLIDSDAKFSELHQLILDDCNYDEHPKQCFRKDLEQCRSDSHNAKSQEHRKLQRLFNSLPLMRSVVVC